MAEKRLLHYDPDMVDELGYGEFIEAADLAGLDVINASKAKGNDLLRFMLAVAFVTERQTKPITWGEAQKCKLEVGERTTANPPLTAVPSPASRSPRATRPMKSVG